MQNISGSADRAAAGFTLIEISIVLVIVGLLLGGILSGRTVIANARANDVVAIIEGLRVATTAFRARFNYLPGDLPAPATDIAAVPPLVAGAGGVIGNGAIDGAVAAATGLAGLGTEVAEAPWQLFNARLIEKIDTGAPRSRIRTIFGPVQLVSAATAGGLVAGFAAANPTARNAIVLFNLPCDIVMAVDNKIDDGNVLTGRAVIAVPACTDANPVPVYAVVL